MKFGSLFTGIGGIDLGLERAGMKCAWQVELDPFCNRVLAKHWPDVPRYQDVTKFCRRISDCEPEDEEGEVRCPRCATDFSSCPCVGTDELVDDCGYVDLIAGGFPCQDISQIGKQVGIGGARSGLWTDYARIVRELRPRFVLVENVARLLSNGIETVFADLAALGYDAEWDCFPAHAVGSPHRRDRVFILAHARGEGLEGHAGHGEGAPRWALQGGSAGSSGLSPDGRPQGWWAAEPAVGRVAHGVPRRVDRLKALGNAVVPQVAEWIGRRIMEIAS